MKGQSLSPAETAFRALLSRPAEYASWAAGVRRDWELENVVWFHGTRHGKPVWRRERPPPDRVEVDPNDRVTARFQRATDTEREGKS